MASSQEQQGVAQTRPPVMSEAEETSSEHAGAIGQVSSDEESTATNPQAGTVGNPEPGIRSSQEELFSQEGTVVVLPGHAVQVDSTPSRSRSDVSEPVSRSETATPRPAVVREYIGIPGLPRSFPSPPSVTPAGPFGVHRGPATSSSLTGSSSPARLNPRAPLFDPTAAPLNMAAAMLARGAPPGAMDPMEIPYDPAVGNVMANPADIAGLLNSAAYHAAMVFKRLMDADSELFASELDRHFTRILGREYQEAVIHVIQEGSENGTVASNNSANGSA